jgi:hypothetical protein
MKNKLFVLILLCVWVATQSSSGATVPAGTTLVVRTVNAISSHAKAGRTFAAKLDQDVAVKGNVLLRAGTQVAGVIEASRGGRSSTSSALTLNLTSVSVNGRVMSIKTTGGFQPQVQAKTARQSRGSFTVGETTFPPGTKLEFRLAESLNL